MTYLMGEHFNMKTIVIVFFLFTTCGIVPATSADDKLLKFFKNIQIPIGFGPMSTGGLVASGLSSYIQNVMLKVDDSTTTAKPSPTCGRKMIKHNELIVKGRVTKPGDWPWHAAIYKTTRNRQNNYIRGGTLLSATRVLTAGHCVTELGDVVLPERLSVALGKYEFIGNSFNSQEKGVYDVILHPDFQNNPLLNDIAMLKLVSKVFYTPYVRPACLWTSSEDSTKESLFGKFGHVVGWGLTEKEELSSQLKAVSLPVATDLACLTSNPYFYGTYLSNKTFCVGKRDGANACNGDSGGGYFISVEEEGDDTWYIRGIVSLSVSRQDTLLCEPNEYTLFSDVNEYMDFINANL